MKLRPENDNKKIDSLGRIVLPKSLRLRLGINTGDEVELYTTDVAVKDGGTRDAIVILPKAKVEDEIDYAAAIAALQSLGYDIPEELSECGIKNA